MSESALDLLIQTPPFRGSPRESLALLAADAQVVELARGERFIKAGDPPERLFHLVEGLCSVFHQHEDGRRVTVKHLSGPATLGEMQVMAGLSFIENAETLTGCRLLQLSGPAFRAYLGRDHRATLELFADVCGRFCVAARNERAILFEVPVRLAGLILSYADVFGVKSAEGTLIRFPLTQQALADGLGVVERSVRRALSEWKKEGVVGTKKGWFIIYNAEPLEKLAGDLRFAINYRAEVDLKRLAETEPSPE
ncbi:MAG: Crp/Fnr family transcriptional regulator [Myxococcota bacterium]